MVLGGNSLLLETIGLLCQLTSAPPVAAATAISSTIRVGLMSQHQILLMENPTMQGNGYLQWSFTSMHVAWIRLAEV